MIPLELTAAIDALMLTKNPILVAIDGHCAAGKSTLAAALAQKYPCNLFHMDDFFLRAKQRTPERFSEIGGNVDYERFHEEILVPLKSGMPFSYRAFDCSKQMLGFPVQVLPQKLNIIEGSYSLHPYFGDIYDLKVFLDVDPLLQRQRILQRPAFLHRRFFEEWIPMENAYFDSFHIKDKCQIIL